MNKSRKEFMNLIEAERERQDKLWGIQEHGDFVWTAILMSEVGDLHKALLREDWEDISKELVHCGAVLFAMYEDRERAIGCN